MDENLLNTLLLINSGLLVFFRLIFDWKVCFGLRKFS